MRENKFISGNIHPYFQAVYRCIYCDTLVKTGFTLDEEGFIEMLDNDNMPHNCYNVIIRVVARDSIKAKFKSTLGLQPMSAHATHIPIAGFPDSQGNHSFSVSMSIIFAESGYKGEE